MHSANDERPVGDDESGSVIDLFGAICDRTRDVVMSNADWAESGVRAGQYNVDVMVDLVCVQALLAAGFDLLSEETGIQRADGEGRRRGIVVVDPLDGSTNASLGLPWFATSVCWVVDGIPVASMVTNHATGERFEAIVGRGAWSAGRPLSVRTGPRPIGDAIVGVSGLPPHHFGWRQFRAMGASALDICAVARGGFDGFVDTSPDAHGVWDYAGAMLVLIEAGGVIVDALGRDLLTLEHEARRTPIAAANPDLLSTLVRSI